MKFHKEHGNATGVLCVSNANLHRQGQILFGKKIIQNVDFAAVKRLAPLVVKTI